MFGAEDIDLQPRIDDLNKEIAKHTKDKNDMFELLAEVVLIADRLGGDKPQSWDNPRAAYDAKGLEADLMSAAHHSHKTLQEIAAPIRAYFAERHIKPIDVSRAAREAREKANKLTEAQQLRARAEQLEREANKPAG
ncbi:MAG: hypothetical protein WC866_02220 [Patescibacteria group bacterium]|jgi:hypothetical protein